MEQFVLCFVKMFLMYICDATVLEEFVSVLDLSLMFVLVIFSCPCAGLKEFCC